MRVNVQEQMKRAIEVLIRYGATKTGYTRINFSGAEDLRIDEVEMLEFLLVNCPETIETLEQVCEHYKAEFKKPSSVSWLLMQTTYSLNSKYNFGWLNLSKREVQDTITHISQIDMIDRHIIYLNKLRTVKPDIDDMFIDAYNQLHSHMNPTILRVEQVLNYLYEELEAIGMKQSYSDYSIACPHGVGRPYFSRSNYGYFIIDNHGCFAGQLFLSPKDLDKMNELDWTYMASRNADRWHGDKARAEAEVKKLEALNQIAGIEGLSWRVEYLNRNDIPDVLAKYDKWIDRWNNQSLFIHKEVPKGCKGKHQQAVKDISKMFKPVFDSISQAWRAKKAGVVTC